MRYGIGFLIALFIALTGVGAGTITVPVLVLFLRVPAAEAVGIGLAFTAAVKFILVPVQVAQRRVAWRTLGFMLLGGAPGVVAGSLLLWRLAGRGPQNLLHALLGAVLVATAAFQIADCCRRREARRPPPRERTRWLAALMLPVGMEVGFSSAGAGALGSVALLGLTSLAPAQVVGTDLAFGFALSFLGSCAHWLAGAPDRRLLLQLIAGGLPGALCGAMLCTRVPRRALRLALLLWLLALGGQLLFSGYWVWAAQRSAGRQKEDLALHLRPGGGGAARNVASAPGNKPVNERNLHPAGSGQARSVGPLRACPHKPSR